MKTTIDIADPLFRAARKEAARRGTTFRDLVESSLRASLAAASSASAPFRLRRHPFGGQGVREGIVEGDWPRVRAAIYEGRGG
jgi:hypothetical protein